MAGKEMQGCSAADAALFEGRTYFLTPGDRGEASPGLQMLTRLLASIGAQPRLMDPQAHDEVVAFASHLPQLLSTALAEVLGRIPGVEYALGPGGRDMTRLAGSSYELWRDILDTNSESIRVALAEYGSELKRIEAALDEADMKKHFLAASEFLFRLHKK